MNTLAPASASQTAAGVERQEAHLGAGPQRAQQRHDQPVRVVQRQHVQQAIVAAPAPGLLQRRRPSRPARACAEAHALRPPGRPRRVEHERVGVARGGARTGPPPAGAAGSSPASAIGHARAPPPPAGARARGWRRSAAGAASATTCASSGAACSGDSGTAIAPARQIAEQRLDERRARLDQERDRGAGRTARRRRRCTGELAVGQAGAIALGGHGDRVGGWAPRRASNGRRGVHAARCSSRSHRAEIS